MLAFGKELIKDSYSVLKNKCHFRPSPCSSLFETRIQAPHGYIGVLYTQSSYYTEKEIFPISEAEARVD